MADREFDVVLFGATGFVGALTAAHLAGAAAPGVRIALAGRSRPRLESVRGDLGEAAATWEVVAVDAADAEGLRRLASRTTVLATTVGPYARYGKEAARAAADAGTHYADLTGEALFLHWTRTELDVPARETGARIVPSCGFDSIPSDLGVLLTAQQAQADGEGTLTDTTLVVRSLKGGFSGGTIDSGRQQAIIARHDPTARRILRDSASPRPRLVERDPESGRWLGPFVMADYNARIVGMSHDLTEGSYGPTFQYREVSDFGSRPTSALRAVGKGLGLAAVRKGLSWAPTRALLDLFLPAPGEGPSEERRASGRFRLEITATTTTGARYRTTVAAPYDPGYDGTAIMLGQSALCLALDSPQLPDRAGVLTPATAMGDVLVDRLRGHGFTFEAARLA